MEQIVFRNVGIQQSDAGEIPKRIHTKFISYSTPCQQHHNPHSSPQWLTYHRSSSELDWCCIFWGFPAALSRILVWWNVAVVHPPPTVCRKPNPNGCHVYSPLHDPSHILQTPHHQPVDNSWCHKASNPMFLISPHLHPVPALLLSLTSVIMLPIKCCVTLALHNS